MKSRSNHGGRSKASEAKTMEIFNRYEKMALYYANQIFDYDRLGMLQEDVHQEFRMKLLTAIKARSRAVRDYNRARKGGGNPIPVMPLEYYLRTSFLNLKMTMIRKISSRFDCDDIEKVSLGGTVTLTDYTDLSGLLDRLNAGSDFTLVYNGVDLLEGLETRAERMAFILYVRGYSYRQVDLFVKRKLGKSCSHVLREHKKRLIEKKEQIEYVETYHVEDKFVYEE